MFVLVSRIRSWSQACDSERAFALPGTLRLREQPDEQCVSTPQSPCACILTRPPCRARVRVRAPNEERRCRLCSTKGQDAGPVVCPLFAEQGDHRPYGPRPARTVARHCFASDRRKRVNRGSRPPERGPEMLAPTPAQTILPGSTRPARSAARSKSIPIDPRADRRYPRALPSSNPSPSHERAIRRRRRPFVGPKSSYRWQ